MAPVTCGALLSGGIVNWLVAVANRWAVITQGNRVNDPALVCGHESKVSHRVHREAKPPRTTEKASKALRAKRTAVSRWFSVALLLGELGVGIFLCSTHAHAGPFARLPCVITQDNRLNRVGVRLDRLMVLRRGDQGGGTSPRFSARRKPVWTSKATEQNANCGVMAQTQELQYERGESETREFGIRETDC